MVENYGRKLWSKIMVENYGRKLWKKIMSKKYAMVEKMLGKMYE